MTDVLVNSDAFPLPLEIEEIDPDWLTRALRTRTPGATVHGVKVVDINNGTCTKIRLKLDLDETAKAAGISELVILKGGFETHSRKMKATHFNEVRGYRDILPTVHLPSPACYFADYEEERQQGIVIMEDLLAAGCTFPSPLTAPTFELAKARLTVLARFHAATWNTPKEGSRWDFLRQTDPGMRIYFNQYLQAPEEWQRFVDAPRGASASVYFHDRARIIAAYNRAVAFSNTLPQCIIHGDTHPGNQFTAADGSPGFFDCIPGRCPPMREIAYHIGSTLDMPDRRRWEGALIQHYLEEVRACGAEPPSFDEAWEQYRAFMIVGYVIFLLNESFYQTESVNTVVTARFSAAMLDLGTLELLELLEHRLGLTD